MIYYFTWKRAFCRRIKNDRRDAEIIQHEDIHGFTGDRRIRDRRLGTDRRVFNKGVPYRWNLIYRLFD